MEPQKIRNIFRSWDMMMIAIGCLIVFAAPAAAQTVGDPAKAQMQEMDRR